MTEKKYPLVHPGEILREELMITYNLDSGKLAQSLKINEAIIKNLLEEKSDINADLASRLSIFFGISSDFWINCQRDYNVKLSEKLLSKNLLRSEVKSLKNTEKLNHSIS